MNRMIEIKLKRIERILRGIDQTNRCAENIDKLPRRILPNAKIREIKNLLDMVYETQKLIEELDDMTAQSVYQADLDKLELQRRNYLYPAIIVIEECDI